MRISNALVIFIDFRPIPSNNAHLWNTYNMLFFTLLSLKVLKFPDDVRHDDAWLYADQGWMHTRFIIDKNAIGFKYLTLLMHFFQL